MMLKSFFFIQDLKIISDEMLLGSPRIIAIGLVIEIFDFNTIFNLIKIIG